MKGRERRRRLISHVVLSVYVGILRANNICHCMHTHTSLLLDIYTLLWLHLMCPDGLDLNLFTHTHTHIYNLFLFQSDSGVGMSRERDGQSKWENVIDANGTSSLTPFFSLSLLCNTSSILSANDSRLIKLAQCVNLIRRFPSYSIPFYRRHFPPLCIAKLIYMCVCVCALSLILLL